MNREKIVSSLIVALAGLFYIFASHEFHVTSQLDFGLSHGIHIAIGIVLVSVAIYYAKMKPITKIQEKRKPKKSKRRRSVARRKVKRRARKSTRKRRRR